MLRRRTVIIVMGALVAAIVATVVVLALTKKGDASSFLYSDADKAYLVQWKGSGPGTLWATYVDPRSAFQVASRSEQVAVTVQGSAVSISAPGDTTPTLGTREGSGLELILGGGGGFGPWLGDLMFVRGSLSSYEADAAVVRQQGSTIANEASEFAYESTRDANQQSLSSADECMLYLSGTDVSVVVHEPGASPTCYATATQFGDLGSGGSWGPNPTGQNYPGEASIVCEYADARANTFVTINDAGGKAYGTTFCTDLSTAAAGWYALEGAG